LDIQLLTDAAHKLKELEKNFISLLKELKNERDSNKKVHKVENSLAAQIDAKEVYIKQIIEDDSVNVFCAFSDAMYFTQTRHKEVKDTLVKFIEDNKDQVEKLLENCHFNDGFGVKHYIDILSNSKFDISMDLLILAYIHSVNIRVLGVNENFQLVSETIDLGFSKDVNLALVSLDIVSTKALVSTFYSMEYIMDAGYAQYLIYCSLSRVFRFTEMKNDPVFCLYKNCEYNLWKDHKVQESIQKEQRDNNTQISNRIAFNRPRGPIIVHHDSDESSDESSDDDSSESEKDAKHTPAFKKVKS
jgi:hypothetical protein